MELFEKRIGFIQQKRARRLKEALKNPTRKFTKKKEGDNIIKDLLREKPMTNRQISEKLNRSLSQVKIYLHRMERDGIVKCMFQQRHKTETTWILNGKKYENILIPRHDAYNAIPLLLRGQKMTLTEISRKLNRNKDHIVRYLREYKKRGLVVRIDRYRDESLWTLKHS